MTIHKLALRNGILFFLSAQFLACGGEDAQVVIPSYYIGGAISDLYGSVELQNNGRDNLTITENGDFVFPDQMKNGDKYKITVLFQPTNSTCIVTSGEGAVSQSNVSDISISCDYPSAPVLTLTAKTKQLTFDWETEVEGATAYQLLQNPDGDSDFTQIGDDIAPTVTAHQNNISVHKLNWENALYLMRVCEDQNCLLTSNRVSAINLDSDAIGYFKASNTGSGDRFGSAIAISDDGATLAIASAFEASDSNEIDVGESDNSINAGGAVYVFSFDGAAWRQQAYIKASDSGEGDQFGYSLALSNDGNTLAVGAPGKSNMGAAYIFTRENNSWTQQANLQASNIEQGDRFGSSIALNGNDGHTLAVGAVWSGAGSVYLYNRINAQWTEKTYLITSNVSANDQFGHAVKLSDDGNTLAISAVNETNGAGAVYVYAFSNEQWSHQTTLAAAYSGVNDNFGYALDMSAAGDKLAIGAPLESSDATGIDGDQNNNDNHGSGAVYLFTLSDSVWTQKTFLKASNPESGDRFGYSVALNDVGDELAVSAAFESSSASGVYSSVPVDISTDKNKPIIVIPSEGSEADNNASAAGAVYFFTFDKIDETDITKISWRQFTYIKAPNTDAGDHFGQMIDLDSSGDTLAVGADREASNAKGLDGDQNNDSASESGAVYLY